MGQRNFLVEGVSGTGKTSVCRELRRRGFAAINGDRELAYQGDPETGTPVSGISGAAVHDHHLWRVDEVRAIVGDHSEQATFFCGGSRNVDSFIGLFDGVFVLTVDVTTLDRRLDERDDDDWAAPGHAGERALVHRLHETGADTPPGVTIDATRPLEAVVDDILRRCDLLGS